MINLIDKLQKAQMHAIKNKPKVGGFPYLAEVLRRAGVKQNIWSLPSCQSIYIMQEGQVIQQGKSLVEGSEIIPHFNKENLIKAIRTDQRGESTFPEFLMSAWLAGVTWYKVDFDNRTVTYGDAQNNIYVENYPLVEIE